MDAAEFLDLVIFPNAQIFTSLCPKISVGREACVMMIAIAGQESDWQERRQIRGPARSYWQFERMGGVVEVMDKCPEPLRNVTLWTQIPYQREVLFEAMAWNDALAFAFARLLLWQDRAPLPPLGAEATAWDYYLRNWRPGVPRPEKWPRVYRAACEAVQRVGRG